ncbi:mitochondrial chaperone BCS1 [Kwoniella heveanensis BCC8398]|uniref:Mitochondrial chaperone BCS1 n=1 Tax=Kwoniella heveanensis BCC8398 TaxID=1296120 RepID=A0A1B9GQF7_9TREE|nr:mitochondrial chaperone BCS1 [Kwoniella heveanensis BCC8398]
MFRPRPQPAAPSATSTPEAGPSTLPASMSDAATQPDVPVSPGVPGPSAEDQSFVSKIMADNPYFSAGAGLMGIGVVLTVFRRGMTLGTTFAQRRLLVSLEIPSKDRAYPWFLEWMAANSAQQAGKGKRPMGFRSHELAVETTYKQHENGSSEAVFNLVPGPGTHYFKYQGTWFQVKRERDAKLMDLHSGSPWETLTLTTLSAYRGLFSSLLSEARALAEASTEGKTVVYTAWGVEWRPFGKPRARREMGSVVLAEGVSERIENDLKSFLGRGRWYAERGIPYRRGYLLHGPPGSGKTSYIQALAGSLNYNICLLNLAERGLTDDKLNHLLGLVPERSFILLEDVDSAFNRRVQTSEDGYKSAVTFSGLLNALDGVASSEERIIFMTTNHYDRLDPALIRPGRVDVHELLGDAAGEQAKRLFVKFYGNSNTSTSSTGDAGISVTEEKGRILREGELPLSDEEVESLGNQVKEIVEDEERHGRAVSMASLQGHFIRTGAKESVEGIRELCRPSSAAE